MNHDDIFALMMDMLDGEASENQAQDAGDSPARMSGMRTGVESACCH